MVTLDEVEALEIKREVACWVSKHAGVHHSDDTLSYE